MTKQVNDKKKDDSQSHDSDENNDPGIVAVSLVIYIII